METRTGLGEDLIRIEVFVDCKDTCVAIVSNKKFLKGGRLTSLEVAKMKEMIETGVEQPNSHF